MNPFANLTAFDGMVVLTSISLVFAMLVALCFILTGEGKLFDAIMARKTAARKKNLAVPAPAPTVAAAPAAEPAAPAAPAVADGIPPEVVAAISAAVYYLEGAGAAVRGIRRLPGAANPRRRGAWGDAGVAQNVRPF